MKYQGSLGEYIELSDLSSLSKFKNGHLKPSVLGIIWFQEDGDLIIDSQVITFQKNDILPILEHHKLEEITDIDARLLRFNRPFYCILDHDHEVGCKGLLYYGTSIPPRIHFVDDDLHILQTVWNMITIEMETTDNLQLEMLQTTLKRLLIHITRMYKKQSDLSTLQFEEVELVRDYNYLVEQHFRTNMKVSDYAKLLHRSPKTLANHFKKIGKKTPLEFIHERKMLEARRLLSFTDKQISEIAFEIGFEDVQAFSKFFKKKQGVSPTQFMKGNF